MTRFWLRRSLAAILCGLLALTALSACGDGNKKDAGSKSVSAASAVSSAETAESEDILKPEVSETSAAAVSSGAQNASVASTPSSPGVPGENKQESMFGDLAGTTLRIVTRASQTDWEKQLIQNVKKKYRLKAIETQVYSYAEEQTKIPMLVASGDLKNYLDLCTTGATTLLRYVYGNVLAPVGKYIDRDDPVWKYPGSGELMPDLFKVDGEIYGSPTYGYQETFIFYNKTYFNEKRVKDPYKDYYLKDNWNFETFKQVAKDATDFGSDNQTVKTYGFATWNYFAFLQAAGNTGIQSAGKGKWNVTVDQPSGLAALQLLYDCSLNNWFTSSISGYTEFRDRKTAMLVERPANAMGGTDAYNTMVDEIGMVPMPKWKNSDKEHAGVVADGWGVPACVKNKPGAVMFIYEYQKASIERYNVTSGEGLKARRRLISDEHLKIRNEYMKKAQPNMALIDGLAGWYDQNRGDFFKIMFDEKTKPANALDRMLPLLKNSLTKTVG